MSYCVIGAGAAGLSAARRLAEKQIPFEVLERESEIGGIWNSDLHHSPVYQSTHLISSKPLTEYPDFPMPSNYPDYPHQSLVVPYFKAFAKKYNLTSSIRFNTSVEKIEKVNHSWQVYLKNGPPRTYKGLILASGFTEIPNFPKIDGYFNGKVIHSKFYKIPKILEGKRVLIVGAGNSGCDIAGESAQHARSTCLSMRRGYYFIPKYVFGKPSDQVGELALKLGVPLEARRRMNELLLRVVMGRPEKYGFPKPDHKLLESHPIINSKIFNYTKQGKIIPKPDIERYDGNQVLFKDGTRETIDLIIYATGYSPRIPYMDLSDLNWQGDHPELFMHVFHPNYDNLFVLGMLQPDSGTWGIFDAQSKVIAQFISSLKNSPEKASSFNKMKSNLEEDRALRSHYLPSLRHHFEVEHFSYLKRLKKLEETLQ